MNRRGFSVLEALIAVFLVLFGFMLVWNVFIFSLHHATQTRDRALALILAENLLEEIRAHPYGAPKPADWGAEDCRPGDTVAGSKGMATVDYTVVVEGRAVKTTYHYCIGVTDDGNGSFFGKAPGSSDALRVSIRWRQENVGRPGHGVEKKLDLRTVVWREADVTPR